MIKITQDFAPYNRNLGNKLFTYAIGRIFAKELNLKLEIPNPSYIQRNGYVMEFPYGNVDGNEILENENYVCDRTMSQKGIELIIEESKGKSVFLDGYFPKYEYIKKHKFFLKEVYSEIRLTNDGKNDVVIMLRDSNCDSTFKLPDEYYLNILEELKFDTLYVCFDHFEKHRTLFEKISKYFPIFIDENIIDSFKFITSKNTIIACQGTFSFWA